MAPLIVRQQIRATDLEWQDPTFDEVVRRLELRRKPRQRHAHVIFRPTEGRPLFWDGTRWTNIFRLAERYDSDRAAWEIAEPLQDGTVDVELLPVP